jgi:hypothetical protein
MKKVLAAIIVALLLGGTAFAFSWWDNLSQTQNETIEIGEGVTLNVSAVATVPAGKVLVPAGVVLKANDVEEIILTYNIKLDQTALDDLNLSVEATDVQIGGSTDNIDLVNINISQSSATVNDADVLVTVTITIDEPSTQAIYDLIKNQAITFTLTFTGSQA